MRLYYAGVQSKVFEDVLVVLGLKDILVSYYGIGQTNAKGIFNTRILKDRGFNVFMDSGGFSARVSGAKIDVNDYRKFLVGASKYCDVSANLDDGTWENQAKNYAMLSLPPVERVLPVYHIDEYETHMWKELDELFDKHDHIAIGGLAGGKITQEMKTKYLDFVFSRWYKRFKEGRLIKIHGFGMTSQEICIKYPFYSVDSTTWLTGAQFGTMSVWDTKTRRLSMVHNENIKYIIREWDSLPSHVRDIAKLSDKYNKSGKAIYTHRIAVSAYSFEFMRKYVTEVWEKRGIVFK